MPPKKIPAKAAPAEEESGGSDSDNGSSSELRAETSSDDAQEPPAKKIKLSAAQAAAALASAPPPPSTGSKKKPQGPRLKGVSCSNPECTSKDRKAKYWSADANPLCKLCYERIKRRLEGAKSAAALSLKGKVCADPECTSKDREAKYWSADGEPLCRNCYQREQRRSEGKRAKPRPAKPEGETLKGKTCSNPNCNSTARTRMHWSADGNPICDRCYNRPGKATSDRAPSHKPEGETLKGKTCSNPDCTSTATNPKMHWSADGKPICHHCYQRARPGNARKLSKENESEEESEKDPEKEPLKPGKGCAPCKQYGTHCDRKRQQNNACAACIARCSGVSPNITGSGAPLQRDDKCRECGTCDGVEENICAFCRRREELGIDRLVVRENSGIPAEERRTYTELVDLAVRSWRLLHPSSDPASSDEQPEAFGLNYWFMNKDREIDPMVRNRSIFGRSKTETAQIQEMINMLQLEDALNGLLPRPDPRGASQYHTLSFAELDRQAAARGFYKGRKKESRRKGTSALMIEFLIQQDANTNQFQEMSAEDAELIRSLLLADMGESETTENAHANVTHATHNRGMTGSLEALTSLGANLWELLFPQRTSSRGLLCGPNALAISLNQRLRRMGHTELHITSDQLMRLMFPSWGFDETLSHGGITSNELSTGFMEYFDSVFAQNVSPDDPEQQAALGYHFRNITRLRNLDYQQLIGILKAGFSTNLFPVRFGLGIATSAYVDNHGVLQPPLARIVWQPDADAPVIWIHNNINLGQGEYHHWEGFGAGDGSRHHTALEWGMLIQDADTAERGRWSRFKAAGTEAKTAALRREFENTRERLNRRLQKLRAMCLPCRDKDEHECVQVEGEAHCEGCDAHPENCKWPSKDAEPPGWLRADQVTDLELMPHHAVLHENEERALMRLAQANLPDPRPEGRYLLNIGWARVSSHPGALPIQQVMANLILSMQNYRNVLNNPVDQTSPEVGNALHGLPVQGVRVVIARHGTRRIPTQLGNLRDPMLIAFVNFMHQLLSPANINTLPDEIHFMTMGLAGSSVDATGFGDRHAGFFRMLLDADAQNNINISDRVYLVPLVEHHVVDGVGAHCLDLGDPAYPRPVGPASPHWYQPQHPHLSKHLTKHRLRDVVDRQLQLRRNDANNQLIVAGGGQPNPPPAYPIPGVNVDKLDRYIRALEWEAAWRSAWLPLALGPMAGMGIMHQVVAAILQARNNERNNAMQ